MYNIFGRNDVIVVHIQIYMAFQLYRLLLIHKYESGLINIVSDYIILILDNLPTELCSSQCYMFCNPIHAVIIVVYGVL